MKLPNDVWEVQLSEPKMKELWIKLKDFDRLFSDEGGDLESFCRGLLDPKTIILECEYGILVLSNVVRGTRAEAHLSFWDCKLSIHTDLIRECLLWAFLTYDLRRITVRSPDQNKSVHRFLRNRLGFRQEGIMRNYVQKNGILQNMIIFGILREEVANAPIRNIRTGRRNPRAPKLRRHVVRQDSLRGLPELPPGRRNPGYS